MDRRHFLLALGLSGAAQRAWSQARPGAAAAPAKLTFGLITPRNADLMLRNWNPFLDRMSRAVGLPIERITYPAQGDLVKDFLAGNLDLAWLGNAPALEIVEAGRASVFASMVVQGKTAYRSVLIVPQASPIRSLEDALRDASKLVFGDGDVKSTSGHIVPRYFAFVKRGVNEPDKLFKEVRRASHEGNLVAAARGEVDIATNNTSELDNFRQSRPEEAARVRVIWESPDIPESPMIWRNDLSPALRRKVAAFTYGFGARSDEEKGILWNINKLTAFRKSSNRQLVTIADIEMFNARQRVINDTSLAPEQRQARVEQIIKRGSALELMLKASS